MHLFIEGVIRKFRNYRVLSMLSATKKLLSDVLLSSLMSHVHADNMVAIVIVYNARTDQMLIRHFAFSDIEGNIRQKLLKNFTYSYERTTVLCSHSVHRSHETISVPVCYLWVPAWTLFHVTLLGPRILRWFLNFGEICDPLD